jgi:OmpA-OmpF porin, OOP family
MKFVFSIRRTFTLSALALAAVTLSACATKNMLDGQIDRGYQAITSQQKAIQALNDTGNFPVASYHLAKAQCWLDVSNHEFSRNDRSMFPDLALGESQRITRELRGSGTSPSAEETPLINHAARLRSDLWSAIAGLKQHQGWQCAQQKTACAEVELVHAGNEFNQFQWQHAKPYVQMAEDYVGQAQRAADACLSPVAPVVAAAPANPPAPAPVVVQKAPALSLGAHVLFQFDRRTAADVLPGSVKQVDAAVAKVKDVELAAVSLVGHADPEGTDGYNINLSMDRAKTVRRMLIDRGIAERLITIDYRGDHEPVVACSGKYPKRRELDSQLNLCNQPNRQVTVYFTYYPK